MCEDYLADEQLSIHFSVGLIPVDIETKDKCLNRFLAINLITKKYLVITEYPTIKKY